MTLTFWHTGEQFSAIHRESSHLAELQPPPKRGLHKPVKLPTRVFFFLFSSGTKPPTSMCPFERWLSAGFCHESIWFQDLWGDEASSWGLSGHYLGDATALVVEVTVMEDTKCVIISGLKQHGLSRLAIIQRECMEDPPFASYPVIWGAKSKLVNLCWDFITESRASCVRTTLFSSATIELRFSFITDVTMTWRWANR